MIKERFQALDSLRGIAALQVIIAHSLVAIPALNWMRKTNEIPDNIIQHLVHSPLHFFWSDSEAVILFFVLSGFVLSLSHYSDSAKKSDYISFAVKRIIRLYIPCFAILCISILFKYFLYQPNFLPDFGNWVQMVWTIPINITVIKNIFLLNSSYLDYFDRSLWSLGPEIKLSLILPFFILITRKFNLILSIISVLIFFISYHLLVYFNINTIWSELHIFYYFTFFLMGSLICKYRYYILLVVNKLHSVFFLFLILFAIYLYTFQYSMWWLPLNLMNLLKLFSNQIAAVASVILVIISLSERANSFLNNKFLLFLGKISFSIYLIHAVVIPISGYLLNDYFSVYYIILIAFICCFPLSYLFYKLVEQPSLKLGVNAVKYYRNRIKNNETLQKNNENL